MEEQEKAHHGKRVKLMRPNDILDLFWAYMDKA